MSVRVTVDEVKEIMTNDPDNYTISNAVVEAMIRTANRAVDSIFSDDTTTSEAILTDIEKFYAAHLLAISDLSNRVVEEQIDDARVKYSVSSGKGLDSSGYGQIVKQLDTTGKMANLSKKSASIRAIQSFDD